MFSGRNPSQKVTESAQWKEEVAAFSSMSQKSACDIFASLRMQLLGKHLLNTRLPWRRLGPQPSARRGPVATLLGSDGGALRAGVFQLRREAGSSPGKRVWVEQMPVSLRSACPLLSTGRACKRVN